MNGVVKCHDSNLLQCNGGHILLAKHRAKYLQERMGFVKRRASTTAKVSLSEFEKFKTHFDVRAITMMEDSELVINWDLMGIHYVPVSSWTMAKEGSRRVEIVGTGDKRQINAVFSGTLAGDFLPPQLIYQGKTTKCLPLVEFPQDWHVTYSENHWANETTMVNYVEKTLFPYIERKRHEFQLHVNYLALVRFRGQCTERIFSMLEARHVLVAVVPASCTVRLQPLDVSVNKLQRKTFAACFKNGTQNIFFFYCKKIVRESS